MAPNKKKKKAASNPSRGFATTSQPSKSKATSEVTGENEAIKVEAGHSEGLSAMQTSTKRQDPESFAIQDMSPEQLERHLEDAELQAIIDSYAARCSQDARRQVTKLEQERRQLKSQAHILSIPVAMFDQYADDLLQSYRQSTPPNPGKKIHDVSSDTELLIRLWTLRKTLCMLKLPDVDKAIEHILTLVAFRKVVHNNEYVWGLREILEWYAIQYEQGDLPNYDNGSIANTAFARGVSDDLLDFGKSELAMFVRTKPAC